MREDEATPGPPSRERLIRPGLPDGRAPAGLGARLPDRAGRGLHPAVRPGAALDPAPPPARRPTDSFPLAGSPSARSRTP